MDTAHGTRLSAHEGRRFAWTLAAAFAILALLLRWRGHATGAIVCVALTVILVALGAFVPTRLGPLKRFWMAIGEAIGRVTSPLTYSLLYLVILTPTGWLRRRFSHSPMRRDPGAPSYWITRDAAATPEAQRSAMTHQF